MAKITRDVLLDLLPTYVAGEASEDTRRLVEQYLDDDAELMRIASRMKAIRLPEAPRGAVANPELKAFTRTKQLMFQRSLFLALAVMFTVSLAVAMGFLLDTHPEFGAISFTLGAIFWVGYWLTGWWASKL